MEKWHFDRVNGLMASKFQFIMLEAKSNYVHVHVDNILFDMIFHLKTFVNSWSIIIMCGIAINCQCRVHMLTESFSHVPALDL